MTDVAVIGIGNMGRNHVRIYSEMKECRLVAIADVNRAAEEVAGKFGCRYYTDYKDMLEKERPDAVSVCVPTSLHYKVSQDVIKAGCHILIEKPIASSVKEAEELVRMAKARGLKLTVGHVERFNPAVQKLKEIIQTGKLGKVTSLLARRVGLFPPQIRDANVVVDLAVHDIDVFNYLLGRRPERVFASAGRALINKREDYADIFLRYREANGLIEVNWITPVKVRALNATGTKGYVSLNYITQELVLYESNYERSYDRFGDFVVKFGEPKKVIVDIAKAEPLKAELKHFIDCVKNNKEPLVSGQEAIEVLKAAQQAIESYRRGR
ncbi:MAG: Gfo/Idh/MocA family oxidoreductase [Candidatus Aenigmatarchaeota archaeon]